MPRVAPRPIGLSTRYLRTWSAAVVTPCLILAATGCYEHVVEREAPYATTGDVYEPNVKEDERIPIIDDLEDAAFGPRDSGRRTP